MAVMSEVSREWWRTGRYASRSISTPIAAQIAIEPDGDDDRPEDRRVGVELQRVGDEVAGERPEHVDIAVGEVDQAQHAVHHRVAEGDEGVDGAERQAVDELLEKRFHDRLTRTDRGLVDELDLAVDEGDLLNDGRLVDVPLGVHLQPAGDAEDVGLGERVADLRSFSRARPRHRVGEHLDRVVGERGDRVGLAVELRRGTASDERSARGGRGCRPSSDSRCRCS